MSDLIARLRAAIDAAEREATAAQADMAEEGWSWKGAVDRVWKRCGYDAQGIFDVIERHDPAAVLRRCAADREILDLREGTAQILAAAQAKLLAGAELSHSDTRDLADAGRELCAYDAVLELIAEGYGIEP